MEVPINKQREYVCVEFPGIVENVDKMLKTIGGENVVTKVFQDPSRRMELRFRPQDILCKPMCGDRHSCTNLLLRVRRRKKKKPPDEESSAEEAHGGEEEEYEYKTEMLGMVDTVYKFSSLMDCQYLPMEVQPDGTYKSLTEQISIDHRVDRAWLNKEAPLVITPPIFSRIDNPIDYAFRDPPKQSTANKDGRELESNLIGMSRQRRPHFTQFSSFDEKEVPAEPFPEAITKLKPKIRDLQKLTSLKALFEERPIWSKNALKCTLNIQHEQLKYSLPLVAFYYITGPWRSLWVRLGYDPRTDPKAKIYQLLDFRVRQRSPADKLCINTKRSTYNYNLPNTVSKTASQVAVIKQETFGKDWTSASPDAGNPEKNPLIYQFRPGMIPPYRQMFYQYCDIEEDKIQELLHSNDGKETQCSEKDGWCIADMQDKCRAILTNHLRQVLAGETSTAAATADTEIDTEASADEDDTETADDTAVEDDGNEMELEYLEHLGDPSEMEEEGL